ncbi:MAG: T9SS type A sorting domain-containing protein [Bacteroidota bacterium]
MSETAKSIERTEDGYIIGVVGTHPELGWSRRGFMKIDEEGNLVDETILESDTSSLSLGFSNSGDHITDSTFYCAGTEEFLDGTKYSSILKYDSNGEIIWSQTYGVEGFSYVAAGGITTSDGGFVIVGETNDFPNASNLLGCAFLLKYSSSGEVEWLEKHYSSQGRMIGYSVDELPNGQLVLSGTHRFWSGTFDEPDMFVIKTEPNGQEIWSRIYGSENAELPCFVTALSNGDVLLHGNLALEDSPVGGFLYSARLDSQEGDVIWDYSFSSLISASCLWNRAIEKEDGSITLSGFVQRPDEMSQPAEYVAIAQLSSVGDSIWSRIYRFEGDQEINGWSQDMVESNDQGFVLAGFVWPDTNNSQDVWVLKLDEFGCLIPGCQTNVSEVDQLNFVEVFPNPCYDVIRIKSSSESRIKLLSIYNLEGEEVFVRYNPENTNTTAISLDVSHLGIGCYVLVREDERGLKSRTKFFKNE